jgi:DNA-binding transcriptional MerR regulator
VDVQWTLSELVAEAAASIATLPAPKNGQVRPVPDERTVRYYGTIGLLDRPAAMRGRTALYNRRHLAQVVAIKRLQSAGRSLAEIQTLWPTLDAVTLARMSGIELAGTKARREFWKREPHATPTPPEQRPLPITAAPIPSSPLELRLELAPGTSLVVALADDVSLNPADVRALRAAAAPLVAELAKRGLIARSPGTLEES